MSQQGQPISVALVGIGGYGNRYVTTLLDAPPEQANKFRFVGAADPKPESCERVAEIRARGVPIYPSFEALYGAHPKIDLAMICTPLQLHAKHTCFALERGSHVLCEKPLCVTPEQIREMIDARQKAQKQVAIGYQWSFSNAIQDLKRDILSGRLGKPKRLRTLVLWPRDEKYYHRNAWAGAKTDGRGEWVLDSPVNNACAHYLHNPLYVLGPRVDRSAQPTSLTAELYRAHAIQNYDTAALRCRTSDGIEILFLVSHATAASRGPMFEYQFEKASVHFTDKPGAAIVARFHDGAVTSYGSPNDGREAKVWRTIDLAARQSAETLCGIEAASAHSQCVWAAQQSTPEIVEFPAPLVRVTGQEPARKTAVDGLDAVLEECYDSWKLPSELGVSWSVRGREVPVDRAI